MWSKVRGTARLTRLAGSVPFRAIAAPGAMIPIDSAIASQKRGSRRRPRSRVGSASLVIDYLLRRCPPAGAPPRPPTFYWQPHASCKAEFRCIYGVFPREPYARDRSRSASLPARSSTADVRFESRRLRSEGGAKLGG